MNNYRKSRLWRFVCDEQAVSATEYAVLLALILVVAIVGITAHGNWVVGPYQALDGAF